MTPMDTQPKQHPATRDKRSARDPAKTSGPQDKPFFRFYHSAHLRAKTLAVIEAIEQAEDATVHREALADIAIELMDSGIDYFFLHPLKLAKVGFLVQQSANLGMAGAQQVMGTAIRNIVGRMDTPQLLSVCASIRKFML
jgi:hypothetical protein